MRNTVTKIVPFVVFILAVASHFEHAHAEPDTRPNLLVIMADDLGFSDIGCYGSEIDTPNLDALAAGGLRFSQFYNTAKCHSSRVSLLTGQYCIAAGNVKLTYAVTSAEVLRHGGYFTAMTGKWHLSGQPTDFGFDRYFGHLSGACNYFKGDSTFRLNGEAWKVPEDDFYTTVANIDFALKFLKDARDASKPWYLYVAFNAPHAPLQALPEDYAKYKGRYDRGWDQVREARIAKQKRVGLLPDGLTPSPRPEHIPGWSSLSEKRRTWEAKRMTTLAAMIDRIDREVGRLVDDLRASHELDGTMILFVSDNGACPYDRRSGNLDAEPTDGTVSWSDSTGWAWVRNSPFRYYKQNQFEGGISTPAIVHWPAGLKTQPGVVVRNPAHLIDVMPTLAEIGKSPIPDQWPGRELRPVSGVSLAPIFRGEPAPAREPIHLLFSTDRGLRDNDWKAVGFRGEAWELYNVANDRTELHDLAASESERLQRMTQQWTDMTRDLLHAAPKFYSPVKPSELPHRHPEWTDFEIEPQESGSRMRKSAETIRARKNTELQIENGVLHLQFTGDDPGIAIDQLGRELANGPYRLSFRLSSKTEGKGEVFYTTKPGLILPKGNRVEFDVKSADQWQDVRIEIATNQRIHKLRIDVSEGPGEAAIADLKLSDQHGNVLIAWPKR
jgi:arylsulfatase A-like enzyme